MHRVAFEGLSASFQSNVLRERHFESPLCCRTLLHPVTVSRGTGAFDSWLEVILAPTKANAPMLLAFKCADLGNPDMTTGNDVGSRRVVQPKTNRIASVIFLDILGLEWGLHGESSARNPPFRLGAGGKSKLQDPMAAGWTETTAM